MKQSYYIIHNTGSKGQYEGHQFDNVRDYHMKSPENGGPKDGPYRDIGYHEFIERDGTRKKGRTGLGAHTFNYNKHYGVCLAGNLRVQGITPEQHKSLMESYVEHSLEKAKEGIQTVPKGHREFKFRDSQGVLRNNTSCPSGLFQLNKLKSDMKKALVNAKNTGSKPSNTTNTQKYEVDNAKVVAGITATIVALNVILSAFVKSD